MLLYIVWIRESIQPCLARESHDHMMGLAATQWYVVCLPLSSYVAKSTGMPSMHDKGDHYVALTIYWSANV